ncbi:TRAP transporter substrate-binding protein DctP [Leptothrix sp. BB-4]
MKDEMPEVIRALTCAVLFAFSTLVSGEPAPPRQIKFAMQGAAGSAQHDAGLRFADIVRARSQGRLEISLHGAGQLGHDLAVVSAVRGGTIEMAILNTSLLSGVVRQLGILDFPFLFSSTAEAYAVMDGPFGQKLHDMLAPRGLVGLCYWGVGVRHFHSGKRPIVRLDDLQGMKIRVVETPVYVDFMSALGAQPVPLPFTELYAALESGAVDGGTQQVSTLLSARLHEVQNFVTLTGHIANPQSVIFSKKLWDTLPPVDRDILREAALSVRAYARQALSERDAQGVAMLQSQGMQFNELGSTELARMKALAQVVIARHTLRIGPTLVRELEDARQAVRRAR